MDADGDDWGSTTQPSATGGVGTDCLDAGTGPGGQLAIAVKPGATEICDADNFDEDCDGTADDADTSVSAAGKVTYYRDDDGDGFANLASAGTPTCDPAPPYIALASSCTAAQLVISPNCDCNDVLNNNGALMDPGNTEVCDGGNVDEDCDGAWDDNDTGGASGKSTYYADSDGDGFGNSSSSVSRCDMPSGYVTNASDCATINAAGTTVAAVDTSARTYPGAQEYCDGVRTDCRASNSTDGQFEFGLISYTTSANAAWNSATFTNVTDRDVTPTYRLAESFTDSNVNGVYDAGETYVDTDGNGVYTGPRTFTLTSSTTYNICPWPSASSWTNASGSTVNGTPPGTANNYYARFVVGATSGTGSTGGITATLRGCPTDAGASCSTAASTNTAITLNGAGIAATSGAPHGGLLKVYPSVTANTPNAVTMSNLTLTGGRGFYATNTRGGAIHLDRNASDTGTEQTLALTNVVITGNSVLNGGGGVALVNSARMTMNGVTVSSNSGAGGGGLLLFNTARVEATGGSITGNSATSSAAGNGGGGIYVQNAAQLSLTNVAVSSNTAPLGGGVLVTNTARVDMSGGSINGNRSSTNGGGGVSMAVNARMRVVNTSITGNCAGSLSGTTCTANNVGGGVLISGSAGNTPTFHCVGSTAATTYGVYANTSTYGGGIAVSANYGNVCLNTCDFGHGGGSSTNNTASSSTNTRSMSYLYSSAWRATSGGGSTWPEGTMGDDQPNGSSKNYAFAGLATPTITTPAACTLP
jgi:hypothetical protein